MNEKVDAMQIGLEDEILFTFPVVVSGAYQTLWQAIEPFVDQLDIPCKKFIISLKSRHYGTATYNVGCVVKFKSLSNYDFTKIQYADYITKLSARQPSKNWSYETESEKVENIKHMYGEVIDKMAWYDELRTPNVKSERMKQTGVKEQTKVEINQDDLFDTKVGSKVRNEVTTIVANGSINYNCWIRKASR